MKDKLFTIFVIVLSIALPALLFAHAQTIEEIDKTLSETDNRKSFGYCPSNDDSKNILDSLGIEYYIEGCPLSRIYIENWDKINETDKQLITDYLLVNGYKIESE